ncbi:hypothetical protein FGG08_006680 [Glutinoglossum americanum]|uniref:Uncharacterized protein n=1 Tax=Glutinoglossum americanum TaxID=1670608 RepID=A0A9P8L1N3_9PEZI|nr:hypothetical protein FGG08_006680 [Glutinoglossum americanum]
MMASTQKQPPTKRARQDSDNRKGSDPNRGHNASRFRAESPRGPARQSAVREQQVQRALLAFRDRQFGRRSDETTDRKVLKISPTGYEDLLKRVSEEDGLRAFVERKLRYDYDPKASELTLRIPDPIHDLLVDDVADEVKRQIQDIFSQIQPTSALAQFLYGVRSLGHADVEREPSNDGKMARGHKSPDISFGHIEATWPGLIIEVAYSQRAEGLRRTARKYAAMTGGNVRMIVGLSIRYPVKKGGGFLDGIFVWEPRDEVEGRQKAGIECTVSKTFSQPNFDSTADVLNIPLGALAPRCILEKHGIPESQHSNTIISIPFATFESLLSAAKMRHELSKPGLRDELMEISSQSSGEQFGEGDEDGWERREEEAALEEIGDSDWEE